MTRVLALAGLALTLPSLLVLPWALYGEYEFALHHVSGWPVHAASALALQVIVAWTVFLPDTRPRAWFGTGLGCAGAALASAIVLGSRYNNPGDFFDEVFPLVFPSPGLGSAVAVLAAALGAGTLILVRVTGSRRGQQGLAAGDPRPGPTTS